jgi:hypothetical protein
MAIQLPRSNWRWTRCVGLLWGIIQTNTDVDVFRFELSAGNLQLNFAVRENPNLDILANLITAR